jgi:hypothetical protein
VFCGGGHTDVLLGWDESTAQTEDGLGVIRVGALVFIDEVSRPAEYVEYRSEVDVDSNADQNVAGARAGLPGERQGVRALPDLLLGEVRRTSPPSWSVSISSPATASRSDINRRRTNANRSAARHQATFI